MRLLLYAYTDTEISDVYDLLDTLDAKQFATNIEKASLWRKIHPKVKLRYIG